MPLFERNYEGVLQSPDGKTKERISPHIILQRTGPLLEVLISVTPEHKQKLAEQGAKPPEAIQGFALIDTGASITAVDEGVCEQLGLTPTGRIKLSHATGTEDRSCYPVQIFFPGTPLPPMGNPQTVSCKLGDGQPRIHLLFGRDLLSRLRMVYHGPAGRIELAF